MGMEGRREEEEEREEGRELSSGRRTIIAWV